MTLDLPVLHRRSYTPTHVVCLHLRLLSYYFIRPHSDFPPHIRPRPFSFHILLTMSLAPAAAAGFHNAAAYDAHRPAYPAAAVQALLTHMHLADKPHARLVEVAAGTGKFTEALAGRHEGFEVVAVEPHEEMRRALEAKALRGVCVRAGRAEELRAAVGVGEDEGEGGRGLADGVVVAQAFHWFAEEAALRELGGVVKAGGVLGLVWNIDDCELVCLRRGIREGGRGMGRERQGLVESMPANQPTTTTDNKPKSWTASTTWAQHLNDWIHSLAVHDDSRRFRDMAWQAVFERRLATNPVQVLRDTLTGTLDDSLPLFSVPLGEDSVAWTHWLSEAALWARINTLSHVALLAGEERARGERVFGEAMRMGDVVRNEAGEIECHGRTYLAWTDRL